MRNEQELHMTIAMQAMGDHIPADLPLDARLLFAMRYTRKHSRELFFLTAWPSIDLMMKSAIGVVLAKATPEEQDIIKRSLAPLTALNAVLSGVPVDVERIESPPIKILDLWAQSEKPE